MSTNTEYRISYTLPNRPEIRHAGMYVTLEGAEMARDRYAADDTNLPGAVFQIESRTVTVTDWEPAPTVGLEVLGDE